MKLPKDLEVSLYKDFADESNYLASLIGAQAVLEHEMIKKLEEALEFYLDLPEDGNVAHDALASYRAWKEGQK